MQTRSCGRGEKAEEKIGRALEQEKLGKPGERKRYYLIILFNVVLVVVVAIVAMLSWLWFHTKVLLHQHQHQLSLLPKLQHGSSSHLYRLISPYYPPYSSPDYPPYSQSSQTCQTHLSNCPSPDPVPYPRRSHQTSLSPSPAGNQVAVNSASSPLPHRLEQLNSGEAVGRRCRDLRLRKRCHGGWGLWIRCQRW